MEKTTVVIAGATGNLGERIATALVARGATVRALVRRGSPSDRVERLKALGAEVTLVEFADRSSLTAACRGAACVVSALSGLEDVIVGTQSVLLDAAVSAGVPRFIPSDYSIDFTRFPAGQNRNLDWRRAFHRVLETRSIRPTSIFNGAFTDMLTGQAPFILPKIRRVLCWGSPDQRMDFTTIEDTAIFTAAAALDAEAPRFLRIAGDQPSARDLLQVMSEISGERYRLLRPGGLGVLRAMIRITRALTPESDAIYPPWQGMQYFRNMAEGHAKIVNPDNDRYGPRRWTTARDVLEKQARLP